MEKNGQKTGRRQAGIGLAMLGLIVLALAGIFALMAVLQPDCFHLFLGRTHLLFDVALATVFISAGLLLVRSDRAGACDSTRREP